MKNKVLSACMVACMMGLSCFGANHIFAENEAKSKVSAVSLSELPTYSYTQQEIEVYNGSQKIYGVAYIPDTGAEELPLVLCSHGLGGSYRSNAAYAEQLAEHGIAAYTFDFRGGGGSMSDGATTEMSVMTEISDLECVLASAQTWDFVDCDRIALLGTSQGGIVSAITAARHSDELNGLMLLYPAFLVSDSVHEMFDSLDEVPDSYQFNWITAGRPYAEDMWDYDVYSEIGNYTKKVLLMHGTADSIVPISYSERAAEVYPDVEYYTIAGGGHGFSGSSFTEATAYIFDYVQEIGLLTSKPVAYTIEDVRNLQDFLLTRPTEDLSGKPYDLDGDGAWTVFDLCLMKRQLLEEMNKENEIKIVPESYNSSAEHQGTVEAFSYDTNGTTKTAYVYLPYGYDENSSQKYNILYFMHGGGGNAGQFYNRSYALNDILDHAIENNEIDPLIVVTPTFYPPNDTDTSVSNAGQLVSVFHEEFIQDLMPAVEGHYNTYAENTTPTGLEASRNHRAFGGFSMGSVTTWYQFVNALDYVAYFMPLSGDCWEYGSQGGASYPEETAAYLNDVVASHKYGNDFYIYAMTGGSDIALNAMSNQIEAMKHTDVFHFGNSPETGNITFQILEGATHDYTYYRNYIYTILPYFFHSSEKSEQIRMTIGDTMGYVTLNDNVTAQAFKEMLPLTITMSDWDGREYWYSQRLPYDEEDVIHDYAPGQLTYWCGGWLTAYYDTNDDTVIEAGSVVIGEMDDSLTNAFKDLNGQRTTVTFSFE